MECVQSSHTGAKELSRKTKADAMNVKAWRKKRSQSLRMIQGNCLRSKAKKANSKEEEPPEGICDKPHAVAPRWPLVVVSPLPSWSQY